MEDKVMLSICCATYNHEKYIKKAFEGILMQKVNFKYEIIVGEDCSTDNSRAIIQSYEQKYPDIFKVIYHEKNVGSKMNFIKIMEQVTGKYIIVLETDDYWIDENKLQQQFDILEGDERLIAVAHNCVVVDSEDNLSKYKYPECKKDVYKLKYYRRWILPGQYTTVMYRNYFKIPGLINEEKLKPIYALGPGDRIKMFALASRGRVKCIQKKMSAYRYVTQGGHSFSATNRLKYHNYMRQYCQLVQYAESEKLNRESLFTAYFMYYEALMATYYLEKGIEPQEFKQRLKTIKHKPRCFLNLVLHVLCRIRYNIFNII